MDFSLFDVYTKGALIKSARAVGEKSSLTAEAGLFSGSLTANYSLRRGALMKNAAITFACDDSVLSEGFRWAKAQALAYVHDSDPVGPWYEAALPGRDAFCMRDVSHQAAGAHFLGLAGHTKNMLLQFAKGISESRDWCSYWEITRYGTPAPVDYTDDTDFWYNLPANFDVMDACWRMYCLTGDRDYIEHPDFINFYDRTVSDYVSCWDHDGDGIPDRAALHSRRGIPSYDEQKGMEQMAVASDLIAAHCRGYLSYARLRSAPEYERKARTLSNLLSDKWWDPERKQFYGAMQKDGTMLTSLGSPHLLAYFDTVSDARQRQALLEQIHAMGTQGVSVELLSHYPEIFYRHGEPRRGELWLRRLIDPGLKRREYPEASFSAIGVYAAGLFGLSADPSGKIETDCHLPDGCRYMELLDCPLLDGAIDIRHEAAKTVLCNKTGCELRWNGTVVKPGSTQARQNAP